MSASTTPDSSFTQERNDKTSTMKLSLKDQPKSLPNLFESMNLQDGKPKPYSSQNKAIRSRVKSFEGKKVALNPVLTNIDGLKLTLQTKDSPPLSSLRISNTDKDLKKSEKAISSNNKSRTQLYQELKETKENVLASRVGYFSRNAFEAKMGSDCGPSLKISNTDEVWAKIEKTQERSNRNPTLKLSLKGHQSLPNLFESLNLQEGKNKPYSQNKVVAR